MEQRWKRFWRLSQSGFFEAFFDALASLSNTAHLVQMLDSAVTCAHVSAAGAKGGSTKISPSRGGFSSEIHLKTDFDGLPIAFHLTSGEASDSRQFDILLDIGLDITPRAVITDKGYDERSNRAAARQREICPVIPYRENTVGTPKFFPKLLYKGRVRIEQTIGKLKRFKRLALRCGKTVQNFASFVAFVRALILVKSVHRA